MDIAAIWSSLREAHIREVFDLELQIPQANVVTGWGLPIHDQNILIKPDDGFGWSKDHIEQVIAQYPRLDVSGCTKLDYDKSRSVGMLTYPGGYTYGHWLIDIPCRLEILSQKEDFDRMLFIVGGPVPDWFLPILGAYGIGEDRLIPLGPGTSVEVSNLIIPNFLRKNDFLPVFPRKAAFARLRSADQTDVRSGERHNLYVKHTPMSSAGHRRTLMNGDDLERSLVAQGFKVIEPASVSRREMIDLFSSANIIVGEDSSALHNVIFSSLAKLLVLSSISRFNLIHYSISRIIDCACEYLFGEDMQDGFFISPKMLAQTIESLK